MYFPKSLNTLICKEYLFNLYLWASTNLRAKLDATDTIDTMEISYKAFSSDEGAVTMDIPKHGAGDKN